MRVIRLLVLGAVLMACGFAATAVPASASQTGAVAEVTGSAPTADTRSGGTTEAPPARVCRTHNPPGAGSATACRTWYPEGGGYYHGSWNWSGTSGVYVQGWFDGRVYNLAPSGTYSGVKKFLTRGCKGSQCTGWS
ncbi:hypothetical protein [Allosalinactinospora lopnorensis]|uniref:hypothetical protein n=1 Tax=Allosalinactinospora lopnorensis TaxID=1352348 RepID=UPI00191C276E|nr:hypothetical protein [Allosalinactinospora lopnorensis]